MCKNIIGKKIQKINISGIIEDSILWIYQKEEEIHSI